MPYQEVRSHIRSVCGGRPVIYAGHPPGNHGFVGYATAALNPRNPKPDLPWMGSPEIGSTGFDAAFRAATDPFMPEERHGLDEDARRRARLALGAVAAILTCGLLALVRVLAHGIWHNAVAIALLLAGVACVPFVLRRTGSLRLAAHAIAGSIALEMAFLMLQSGARTFPPFVMLPGVPMIATLIGGTRAGLLWAGASLVQVAVFYSLFRGGLEPRIVLSADFLDQGRFTSATFMIFFVLFLTHCYERLKKRALEDLEAERRRQIRIRDRFLSHVSHELRTPIAAAKQYMSLILDGVGGKPDEEHREYLEGALRNTDELVRMIGDLIAISRARAGELRLELTEIAIEAPLTEAVRERTQDAEGCGITISLELADGLPNVRGARFAVHDVVAKLLDNALKFSPEGSRIVVAAEARSTGGVCVHVLDEGPGIEPERRAEVFDELRPGSPPEWTSRRGLGLGLALARELVHGMAGEIGVSHRRGGGSDFHFSLPGIAGSGTETQGER